MSKSIWELPAFKPFHGQFLARQREFRRREQYYNGAAYATELPGETADPLKQLYYNMVTPKVGQVNAAIKGLLDPIQPTVDIDVGLVPGGWITADPESQAMISEFLTALGWGDEEERWLINGASMGQAPLLIVNERYEGPHGEPLARIQLQALRPDSILVLYGHQRRLRRTIQMAIIVEQATGADGKPMEEATVITPTQIMDYRNGEPFALVGNSAARENELGFVPVVDVPFKVGADATMGKNSFCDVLPQLDAVNKTATQLSENIRKNSNPQWVVMTDDEMGNKAIERSDTTLWKLSSNGGVEAIVASLDIPGVMQLITATSEAMQKKLPQYLLHKIMGLNRVAYETVQLELMPLIIHIQRVRRSMDRGLGRAIQMAARVAMAEGVWAEYAPLAEAPPQFDLMRPVIPLSDNAKLDLEIKAAQLAMQVEALEAQRQLSGGEVVDDES